MKRSPTPHGRVAELYRKAARAIERGEMFNGAPVAYACHALELVEFNEPAPTDQCSTLCAPMKEIFAPDSIHDAWLSPWGSGDDAEFSTADDVRILALCFMAAITERP